MRRHLTRNHLDVDALPALEVDGATARIAARHTAPRRVPTLHRPTARDERHRIHQQLHEVERGAHPDELD